MNTVRRRDPTEEISLLIELGHITFEQAEKFISAYSPQLPDAGTGTIPIGVLEVVKLTTWAPNDAHWVAAHVPDSLIVSLGFLVLADSDRPAARFYYTNTTIDGLNQHRSKLRGLTELFSLADLQKLAQADGYPERLADYRRRNANPKTELLTQFYEGRVGATTTQQVDILDTGGACLICNEPASQTIVATTISIGDHAQTLALSLCPEHEKESAEVFLFDFLASKFGVVNPLSIIDATSEDIYQLIEKALIELDCGDLKRDAVKVQVTGTRASGMKVILRCELHTQKRSYAYMMTTPSKVNLRRVDNADDHPEQIFRRDHQHLGLPKDNRTVAPSFTFGLATLDMPKIRSELALAERRMQSSKSTP